MWGEVARDHQAGPAVRLPMVAFGSRFCWVWRCKLSLALSLGGLNPIVNAGAVTRRLLLADSVVFYPPLMAVQALLYVGCSDTTSGLLVEVTNANIVPEMMKAWESDSLKSLPYYKWSSWDVHQRGPCSLAPYPALGDVPVVANLLIDNLWARFGRVNLNELGEYRFDVGDVPLRLSFTLTKQQGASASAVCVVVANHVLSDAGRVQPVVSALFDLHRKPDMYIVVVGAVGQAQGITSVAGSIHSRYNCGEELDSTEWETGAERSRIGIEISAPSPIRVEESLYYHDEALRRFGTCQQQ